MKESDERGDPRRQGRAHSVLVVSVLLVMVSGAGQLVRGMVDGTQGWSVGLMLVVFGPFLYLMATAPLSVQQGGAEPRVVQMLRRNHHTLIALAILAAGASLYEGVRGAVSWWFAGIMVAACCSMAMALRQLSSTAS